MPIETIIAKAHSGMAMLLLPLAIISLAFAIRAMACSNAKECCMKTANITGLLETITAGLVTITGIAAIFTTAFPLSQMWIWAGLVIMVIYSVFLKRLTKPARLAISEGGSAATWTGLQTVHVLLVLIAFALMKLKPF